MFNSAPLVSRRTFLGAAIATTAHLAPSNSVKAAEGPSLSGRIKKALKWHMIAEDLSEVDKLKLIKEIGFDGVETHSSLRSKKVNIDALARASEKTGIPVHGVVNSNNPDIETAITDAKKLGATSVLHVVKYDTKVPYLENYAQTQKIIQRALPAAEKNGVQILIENVWASFLIEPMIMAKYVDEIGSPWVKVYFDVGNVVRWGWPEHWLQVIGKRAVKLDIKEYDLKVAMNEGMRKAFDVPIGQGSIDWGKVRSELDRLEYNGWATAEVRGGDRDRLRDIASQMDAALRLK